MGLILEIGPYIRAIKLVLYYRGHITTYTVNKYMCYCGISFL